MKIFKFILENIKYKDFLLQIFGDQVVIAILPGM